ncbi:MAG: META domain-containing protein [Spirochaetota bacterium]|nr:META domain-containing protein [Spirochaetota bacterium]
MTIYFSVPFPLNFLKSLSLNAVQNYQLKGDELTLYNDKGVKLVYNYKKPHSDVPLDKVSWKMNVLTVSIANSSTATGPNKDVYIVEFKAGKMKGYTPFHFLKANYRIKGNKLTISNFKTKQIRKKAKKEPIDIEENFINTLKNAKKFKIKEKNLTIYSKKGWIMFYPEK